MQKTLEVMPRTKFGAEIRIVSALKLSNSARRFFDSVLWIRRFPHAKRILGKD